MNRELLREQVDVLAQQIAGMTRSHEGRLSSIVVAAPPPHAAEVEQYLEESLSVAGIEFVDVTVRPDPGPLRLLRADYEA